MKAAKNKPRGANLSRIELLLILVSGVLLAVSCGGYGGGGGMSTAAPGVFMLSMPVNGANMVGTTPMLTWTASTNAMSGYEVQVELATGDFTGKMVPLAVDVVVGTTTYTVTMSAGLIKGNQYHWRVKAENIYGSMIAGPFTFTA